LQVVHTYQQRQPNMVRGIMQIAACMKTLRCVDRFTTAQIETAILQSLVAFTVESDIPNAVQQMLGAVQGTQMESAALKAVKEHENFRKGYRDAGNKLQIDNTIVPHLVSGERLNMQGLSMSGANFGEFMDVMFTLIARCCGISKEYLTQDWSKTNFSGARAGMLVVYRDIEQFRLRCPTVLAQAIYACWLEDSILDGQIPIPNYPDPAQAWLYFAANRQMLSGSEWRGPAKDEIDRAKVAQWFIGEQTLGVYTVERYCDEVLHTYWEDVAQQQCIEEVRWNKIRADHGLPPLPAGMLHSPSAEAVAVMGALSSENSNDNNAANNGGNNGADDEA
jgi:capsid protein